MERAVFLDRDGVIIEDTGHPSDCSQLRFLPGVSKAIRLLNENGFKVIIVTNQAGVAKGYFSEETVKEINGYIQEKLAKKGAVIDRIYYCPHHTEGIIEEYRKDCYYRKPNPGMIEQAISDFGIDVRSSFLIGDKISDIESGHRAGCRTILLVGEDSQKNEKGSSQIAEHIAPDLYEAVEWLVKLSPRKGKCS